MNLLAHRVCYYLHIFRQFTVMVGSSHCTIHNHMRSGEPKLSSLLAQLVPLCGQIPFRHARANRFTIFSPARISYGDARGFASKTLLSCVGIVGKGSGSNSHVNMYVEAT